MVTVKYYWNLFHNYINSLRPQIHNLRLWGSTGILKLRENEIIDLIKQNRIFVVTKTRNQK